MFVCFIAGEGSSLDSTSASNASLPWSLLESPTAIFVSSVSTTLDFMWGNVICNGQPAAESWCWSQCLFRIRRKICYCILRTYAFQNLRFLNEGHVWRSRGDPYSSSLGCPKLPIYPERSLISLFRPAWFFFCVHISCTYNYTHPPIAWYPLQQGHVRNNFIDCHWYCEMWSATAWFNTFPKYFCGMLASSNIVLTLSISEQLFFLPSHWTVGSKEYIW